MIKKLLCLLCIGILVTGCGQPAKEEPANAETALLQKLEDESFKVTKGKDDYYGIKNYESWKEATKKGINCDIFVFENEDKAKEQLRTLSTQEYENKDDLKTVISVDPKSKKVIGYIQKDNLLFRGELPEGSVDDMSDLFYELELTR